MKNNPYDPDKVAKPELFYGREKIRTKIIRRQLSSSGQSFAILGGRRIGKSSLLEKLRHEFCLKIEQETNTKAIPVKISLQENLPKNETEFWRIIGYKTYHAILELNRSLIDEKFDTADFTWDKVVELLSLFKKNSFGKNYWRLIWMIDEVEVIRKEEWRDDVYFKIRHLISEHALRDYISIIVTAVRYDQLDATRDGSSLLNVLTIQLLGNLTVDAARKLAINSLINSELNEQTLQDLLNRTGRHPHLLQYFLREICENFEDLQDVTEKDLLELVNEYYNDKGLRYENWIRKYFNEDEKKIIQHLLKSGELKFELRRIRKELRTVDGIQSFKIDENLNYLVSSGILNKNGDSYEFAGDVQRKCLNFLLTE